MILIEIECCVSLKSRKKYQSEQMGSDFVCSGPGCAFLVSVSKSGRSLTEVEVAVTIITPTSSTRDTDRFIFCI